MKSCSFFLIILASYISFGQINQKDTKGRKQGDWEKTYPKSKVLEYKGTFKNDVPIGNFNFYYPSTKTKAVIKHDENGRSEAVFYHENGKVMSYGIYRNMKKDSLWCQFNEEGKIVNTETFQNDVLNGKRTVYFHPDRETGKVTKVASVTNFVEGKADGEFVEYFVFGGIREKGTYKNGLKQGIWYEYQPSGKPLIMNRYKNGVRHGWCSAYDVMGKEVNKEYYSNGKLKQGKDLEFLMKQLKEKGVNPNE